MKEPNLTKLPEVTEQMQELDRGIAHLGEIVAQIADRINPILSGSLPADTMSQTVLAKSSLCSFAEELHRKADRVADIGAMATDVLSRIQL